jgi:hypothetical protein
LNSAKWTPGYDPHNHTKAYRAMHPRHIKKTIVEGFTASSKAGCEASGYKRMLVTAKCYDPYIVVTDSGGAETEVQKTTMALVVISCDVLGCALFLVMVWWLTTQEQEELAFFDGATTTCEDYSLMLTVLPSKQEGGADDTFDDYEVEKETAEMDGAQKLALDLKRHIEQGINSDKARELSEHWRGEAASIRDCVVDQIHFGLNNYQLIYKKKERIMWERREMKYQQKLVQLTRMHKDLRKRTIGGSDDGDSETATAVKMRKHVVRTNKKVVRQLTNVEKKLKSIDLQLVKLINQLERDENKQVDVKKLISRAPGGVEEDLEEGRNAKMKGKKKDEKKDGNQGLHHNRSSLAGAAADSAGAAVGAAAGAAAAGAGLMGDLMESSLTGGLSAVSKATTAKLHATTAFVTFETQEGRLRALDAFKRGRLCGLLGGSRGDRFRGIHLQFDEAPNPGNINWENLGVKPLERCLLKLLTLVLTVAFLGLSAGVIFKAKAEQAAMALKYPPVTCPAEIPSVDLVEEAYADNAFKTVGLIECFCKSKLLDILQGKYDEFDTCPLQSGKQYAGENADWCKYDDNDNAIVSEKLCQGWVGQKLRIQSLNIGSVVIVLFVNLILDTMMRLLVKIERKNSRTAELVSIARRVFCASFVNTALISLVIQGNLSFFTDQRTPMQGDHDDFTVGWYSTAGTAFMLTMVLNIVVPHAKVWAMYPMHALKIFIDGFKCCGKPCQTHRRSRQVVQHDLQSLLIGPEWELAARYGQILNVIFVTMMFSSVMPLLNFLAVANFIGIYCVDKVAFLRLYKTPPMYDASLAIAASKQMNLAIFLHLAFGAWAFSNLEILQPVEGMSSAVDALTTSGLQDHLEAAQTYDKTGRTSFLNAVFRDRLFKAVSSVWLYVFFMCFFWVYLLVKEFFLFEISVFLRFVGLTSKEREEEEKFVFNYYSSLRDETLAQLSRNPQCLGSLQKVEVVAAKVKAELAQREKQKEKDQLEAETKKVRKHSVHEEHMEELRKSSGARWVATRAADTVGALGGAVGDLGGRFVRKATGAAHKVHIKEVSRRMVGLESFMMSANSDYYYMRHGGNISQLRDETVENLENEAAWLAVGIAAKLKKANKNDAHKHRPKVRAILRQKGWDTEQPNELVEMTGLTKPEVVGWLSGKEVHQRVTDKMKEWLAQETALHKKILAEERKEKQRVLAEEKKAKAEEAKAVREKEKKEKKAQQEKEAQEKKAAAKEEKKEAAAKNEIEMSAVKTEDDSEAKNPLAVDTVHVEKGEEADV